MLPDRDVLTIDLGAGPAPMAQVLVTRGTVVDEYEIGSYHADGSFTTDNAETIHLRRLHATDTIEVRLANCHTDRVLGRFTVADIPVEQGDVPWTILGAMLALVILALRSLRTPALGVMLPTARVRSCR